MVQPAAGKCSFLIRQTQNSAQPQERTGTQGHQTGGTMKSCLHFQRVNEGLKKPQSCQIWTSPGAPAAAVGLVLGWGLQTPEQTSAGAQGSLRMEIPQQSVGLLLSRLSLELLRSHQTQPLPHSCSSGIKVKPPRAQHHPRALVPTLPLCLTELLQDSHPHDNSSTWGGLRQIKTRGCAVNQQHFRK